MVKAWFRPMTRPPGLLPERGMEWRNVGALLALLFLFPYRAAGQLLAPLDADQQCLGASTMNNSGTAVILLDSHQYLSLQSLWFADDESIDLFLFPVPEDPVRWKLVDQSECRNVWQYCGVSSSDILISQFITGVPSSAISNEVVISVEFAFFSEGQSTNPLCPLSDASSNVLIVEADDMTGQDNVHIELISPCVGSQHSLRHDFIYMPMSQRFELVFRSNLTTEMCVNISRVRIFHCGDTYLPRPDASSASVITCSSCPVGHYLDTETDQCLLCPDFSSSSGDRCICDIGHQRSTPGDYSLPCDECANGYFASDSGMCTGCPLPGLDNIGSTDDACKCFNGTSSSDRNCQFCAANYFRNSPLEDCILCPAGSRRDLVFASTGDPSTALEGLCTCTEGSFTSSGQNTTTNESCDVCTYPLVWNASQCVPCPGSSQPASLQHAVLCTCDPNTLTVAGQNKTITQACFCVDGYYRPLGSAGCELCPLNSFRALSDPEDSCPCLEGFTRDTGTESLLCFPYIGFNTSSLVLVEGEGQQVDNIRVILSQVIASPVSVSISVRRVGGFMARISPTSATLMSTQTLDLVLTRVGNTVALEEDAGLTLLLQVSDVSDVVVGGPGLFGELNVIISDDDLVYIGFTERRLAYNPSAQNASIRVNISTVIAREVVLLLRANDTLSSDLQPSVPRELIFSPTDPTSALFEFDISLDQVDTSYVLISLEVATYPASLNRVRERITVGGYPGLYQEAVVVVGEPGRTRSIATVIGIASAVVIPAACLSAVLIFCVACVCYRQYASSKGARANTPNEEKEMTKLAKEELTSSLVQ